MISGYMPSRSAAKASSSRALRGIARPASCAETATSSRTAACPRLGAWGHRVGQWTCWAVVVLVGGAA